MNDNEITWKALQTQLEEEVMALRSFLSALVEQEQAQTQGMHSVPQEALQEMEKDLSTIQKKRFEATRELIGCPDVSMQDLFFGEWLKERDPDYDLLPLWEQVACLTERVVEQRGKQGFQECKPQTKSTRRAKKIDTLES